MEITIIVVISRNASRLTKDEENDYNDTAILSFDYMQNLHSAKFYTYHEEQSHKTTDEVEVCSFLLDYFENELLTNIKTIFSDGCIEQNKVHTDLPFLMNLADRGRFMKITHYFPRMYQEVASSK